MLGRNWGRSVLLDAWIIKMFNCFYHSCSSPLYFLLGVLTMVLVWQKKSTHTHTHTHTHTLKALDISVCLPIYRQGFYDQGLSVWLMGRLRTCLVFHLLFAYDALFFVMWMEINCYLWGRFCFALRCSWALKLISIGVSSSWWVTWWMWSCLWRFLVAN